MAIYHVTIQESAIVDAVYEVEANNEEGAWHAACYGWRGKLLEQEVKNVLEILDVKNICRISD